MELGLRRVTAALGERRAAIGRRRSGSAWRRANAPYLQRSGTPSREVVFAIPLVSRARAGDWAQVQRNLDVTLAALAAQRDARWRALVCCQDAPDLPDDPRVAYLPSDASPEFNDKGAKWRALRKAALESAEAPAYVFLLDADDILHPALVGHMLEDDNRQGYVIEKGYILDAASGEMGVLEPGEGDGGAPFHQSCGSSSAHWIDPTCGADFAEVLARRGSHQRVMRNMADMGFRMGKVPFHAGIYSINHGQNMRARRGLMDEKMRQLQDNRIADAAERRRVAEEFRLGALPPLIARAGPLTAPRAGAP